MDAEDKIYILNTNAAALAAANNHDRNYIHIFRPHDKSKLNIVGTFENSIKSEYLDLTEEDEIGDIPLMVEEFCSESNNSFGIVTKLDFPDFRDIALGIQEPEKNNFYRSKDDFLEN